MKLELHPLCILFPRMEGTEFDSLVADIKVNGQREPIIVHDGMILDGGNRYRACIEAGIEPQTMKFAGGNIVSYVLSANLHRRHMTASQQATIVAVATDWGKAQKPGKSKTSESANISTLDDRTKLSGAPKSTQRKADAVAKADPNLAVQVAQGKISLNKATKKVAPQLANKSDPIPEPVSTNFADYMPSEEELTEAIEHEKNNAIALQEFLDSDDKLKSLHEENIKLKAENRVLRERMNGLMVGQNESVRSAKSWQNKYLRLEKKLKAAA